MHDFGAATLANLLETMMAQELMQAKMPSLSGKVSGNLSEIEMAQEKPDYIVGNTGVNIRSE